VFPYAELVENLGWYVRNSSLPISEYPLSTVSVPGMWIPIAVIVGTLIIGGGWMITVWSRRPR